MRLSHMTARKLFLRGSIEQAFPMRIIDNAAGRAADPAEQDSRVLTLTVLMSQEWSDGRDFTSIAMTCIVSLLTRLEMQIVFCA